MHIWVGCCGFPTNRAEYYSCFNVIETQITFYTPPKPSTLARWREEAPQGFQFVVKAWQLITHHCGSLTYRRLAFRIPEAKRKHYGNFRPTDEVFEAWETTRECARVLGATKVLFQTPPTFGPTAENMSNMKKFFKKIKRDGLEFIWEPRGKWLEAEGEIRQICLDSDLTHCVIDPFRYTQAAGGIDYFRLHGKVERGHIDYDYQYTRGELDALVGMRSHEESYYMFNNSAMYGDAAAFAEIVHA